MCGSRTLLGVGELGRYHGRVNELLAGLTTPPIPATAVLPIPRPNTTNVGVAAVYVPLTDVGPFRAEGPGDVNGRYFVRTATGTSVMPHQILAAMFGRRPVPRLELGLQRFGVRQVQVWVRNVGGGVARRSFVRLRIDRGQDNDAFASSVHQGWDDKRSADSPVSASLPYQDALFPEEQRAVFSLQFLRTNPRITALLQCEDAPPVRIDAVVEVPENSPRMWFPLAALPKPAP